MSLEISGDSGYLALAPEATEATAVTPTTFVPMYEETLSTDTNPETEMSVFGSKFARLQVTPGVRSHGGELTVMAEPNSTLMFHDMLLTRGSVSGSNPYTWPLTASFTNPKTYTVDISGGNQVFRYFGVQASEISPDWKDNEMRWKIKVAALGSFIGAKIASVSTNVVTLDTTVNSTPTKGLVAGDLVAVWVAAGTRQNFTITSLTSTTVTLSGSPSGAATGDVLHLRPATVALATSYSPFLWSRTEFRVATDATTALSATHTPMESGSTWTVTHPFEDDKGAQRSGSFDPAALVRSKSPDVSLKLKHFFYHPDEIRRFINAEKVAVVVRCFTGTNNEFRLTLNNLKITKGGAKPMIKTDETEYYELEYLPTYDTTDGQAFDIKTINGLASL